MVLGTAFSDQADVLVTEVNFSVPGTFTPRATPEKTLPTGVPVTCGIVVQRTDPRVPVGRVGVRSPGWVAKLNQREVPDPPREGDELVLSAGPYAGTYLVSSLQEAGFSRYWTVQVRAA